MLRVTGCGVTRCTLGVTRCGVNSRQSEIPNPKPIVSQIPDRETLLLICLQLLSTALIFISYGCLATLLDFGLVWFSPRNP